MTHRDLQYIFWKIYLLLSTYFLLKRMTGLLRCFLLYQNTPILHHTEKNVQHSFSITVSSKLGAKWIKWYHAHFYIIENRWSKAVSCQSNTIKASFIFKYKTKSLTLVLIFILKRKLQKKYKWSWSIYIFEHLPMPMYFNCYSKFLLNYSQIAGIKKLWSFSKGLWLEDSKTVEMF